MAVACAGGGDGSEEMGGAGGANKVPVPPVTILTQFNPPAESGLKHIMWRVSLPLIYLFYYTVPDCRMEQWRTWYVITFTMAMLWIAVFSYFMVWMITVVGASSTFLFLLPSFVNWLQILAQHTTHSLPLS